MNNQQLKQILSEYEIKRNNAINHANEEKQKLLEANPVLAKIEEDISKLSIDATKKLLTASPKEKELILLDLNKKTNSLIKQKNSLLKNLSKSSDFLKPKFECKTCKDTGFIEKDGKSIMCSCLKQKIYDISYNQSNIGNLSQENFSKFDQRIFSPKANPEIFKSDLSPRENILLLREKAQNFIDNFDDINEKNLLFSGNTGLRKNFFN